MRRIDDIVVKPILSEKSLQEVKSGRYTFVVAKDATKRDVQAAIERVFHVEVKRIHTNIVKGSKTRLTRFGRIKKEVVYKKARVILGKDQKIDIFQEKGK